MTRRIDYSPRPEETEREVLGQGSEFGEDVANAILLLTGSELTRGETRDLNGPFLGSELTSLGLLVEEAAFIPDDPKLISAALERAIERADLVVLSGGLGPTADDHTVQVMANLFGRRVFRHPETEARMRARALARGWTEETIPPNFFKQAEVIEGAEVLLNPEGLAPGMIVSTERGFVAVLPGVPRELQAIFRRLVVPRIRGKLDLVPPRVLRAKIMGMAESWAEARIQKIGIDFDEVEYGISARPGELVVKFISHRPESHPYLDQVRGLLEKEFGPDLVVLPEGLLDPSGAPVETEHSFLVHRLLLEKKVTVAIAESCTGGLISQGLTRHAGSSAHFLGAVVAYNDRAKETLLGIPAELIHEHGAVSEPVCAAMARAARDFFGADFGISVTGIAGPGGGTPEKPVGLVYLGLASRDRSTGKLDLLVERHQFVGSRELVRAQATVRALDLLRRKLGTAPVLSCNV